jgi:hypothetical protein
MCRRVAGDELLRRRRTVNLGSLIGNEKRKKRGALEMRVITWNVMEVSVASQDGRSGRILRFGRRSWRRKPRIWRQLKSFLVDSFYEEEEENETDLPVVSARPGAVSNGGAMRGKWWYCEVVLLRFDHREKRKARGEEGSGGGREGRQARVCGRVGGRI